MKEELDEVVATRTFDRADGTKVVLKIGRPSSSPDQKDSFRCPFQVIGLGNGAVKFTYGVDGIQALELTLQRAFAYLEAQDDVRDGAVKWLGSDNLRTPS